MPSWRGQEQLYLYLVSSFPRVAESYLECYGIPKYEVHKIAQLDRNLSHIHIIQAFVTSFYDSDLILSSPLQPNFLVGLFVFGFPMHTLFPPKQFTRPAYKKKITKTNK
jgi:hypothetical protein